MVLAEFLVEPRWESEFEKVCGSSGIRTQLLLGAAGYLGTELKRELGAESRYKVQDSWRSHHAFHAFQSEHGASFDELRRQMKAEGIVKQEWALGSFYVSESGPEETDLTPA